MKSGIITAIVVIICGYLTYMFFGDVYSGIIDFDPDSLLDKIASGIFVFWICMAAIVMALSLIMLVGAILFWTFEWLVEQW